jgi:hypothetical protein
MRLPFSMTGDTISSLPQHIVDADFHDRETGDRGTHVRAGQGAQVAIG